MRKSKELTDLDSCLSRATYNEMCFVLLARDAAAPDTIRFWISERIRLGKNKPNDAQVVEALECARIMEAERVTGTADKPETKPTSQRYELDYDYDGDGGPAYYQGP